MKPQTQENTPGAPPTKRKKLVEDEGSDDEEDNPSKRSKHHQGGGESSPHTPSSGGNCFGTPMKLLGFAVSIDLFIKTNSIHLVQFQVGKWVVLEW